MANKKFSQFTDTTDTEDLQLVGLQGCENVKIDYAVLNTIPSGTERQVLGYDSSGNADPITLGWRQFSDLPSAPPFLNGLLMGTAFKSDGSALWGMAELAIGDGINSEIKPNAVPFYNPGIIGNGGGTLPVADGVKEQDAVNVGQLNSKPSLGTTATTAKAGNYTPSATEIVNAINAMTPAQVIAVQTKLGITP